MQVPAIPLKFYPCAGVAGDGTVHNDPAYAHWAYTYRQIQQANNYGCASADSSLTYNAYTGVFPWQLTSQELPDDDSNRTGSLEAQMQMANASFFSSVAGQNKWVPAGWLAGLDWQWHSAGCRKMRCM